MAEQSYNLLAFDTSTPRCSVALVVRGALAGEDVCDGPGNYCYNRSSDNSEKVIVKTGDECPSGFRDGPGHYCYARDTSPDVVVKSGDRCPTGYRDGRGHYCYKY